MRSLAAQLYAPPNYVVASPAVRALIANGCGPGGWKLDLVPDHIWFLDISEACNIHDWMYTFGNTLADKDEADRVLLNNCLRLVDAAGGCWLLRCLRRHRVRIYFEAVHIFGGPAFWACKNPQTHLIESGI
jgi:hypothetical protein